MREFLEDGDLNAAAILKGHHAFIQTGLAYEFLRDIFEPTNTTLLSFGEYMFLEYGLSAKQVREAIHRSAIGRLVLAQEPDLWLHESFIRPLLPVLKAHGNRRAGLQAAAELTSPRRPQQEPLRSSDQLLTPGPCRHPVQAR